MTRDRTPQHGEVKLRLEFTDAVAARAVGNALATQFGADAVTINTTRDRSAPRPGRRGDATPGLTHQYITINTKISPI